MRNCMKARRMYQIGVHQMPLLVLIPVRLTKALDVMQAAVELLFQVDYVHWRGRQERGGSVAFFLIFSLFLTGFAGAPFFPPFLAF
jgi:hypothetical protein